MTGAVARQMDRAMPLAERFPGGAGQCRIAPACRYRVVLAEAEAAFFAVPDLYTVHDLVKLNRELRAVLFADPP